MKYLKFLIINTWMIAAVHTSCARSKSSSEPAPAAEPTATEEGPSSTITANAGSDSTVDRSTQSVTLSGVDSNIGSKSVTYAWVQTAGTSVQLNDANSVSPTFATTDIKATESLTFQLTITDADGVSASDTVVVTITVLTISGTITYDLINHTNASALDYSNIIQSAIRGATVELIDSSDSSVAETTSSDASGNYSLPTFAGKSYVIRVKAELKKSDTAPTWDFTVVDNTSSQALYVMDSATQTVSATSITLNLNASSGWNGSSYSATRVAGPFAILDSVYLAKEKIISADADAVFPALKLNWSINNVATSGDLSLGQIGTSMYNGTGVYILGAANSDTDEYDGHVIIHEWGHYFENVLSRSDSIGGSHSISQKLDLRVAMGEGFGNALSGIVTDDSYYRDSSGNAQGSGFAINVETNPSSSTGWFSEYSVQSILYDLYDSTNDGSDNLSLGFTPIYNALVGSQKTTDAHTSIFSIATYLKAVSPSNASAIDTLLASQNIIAADEYGSTETNNGGDARNLPVYKTITIGGSSVELCSFATNGSYNKLGNRQFIRFEITSAGSYTFTANGQVGGDNPAIYVRKQGAYVFGSSTAGNESTTQNLAVGKYILEAYEVTNISGSRTTCMDVSISAN